ncbi:hypothetical protein [Caballeronia sp. LZ035]|uniref:hypothetical protein n=1 Tax=Caballeronia sp. LZ035 TaxID=3038568 RepID=UPI002860B838|nr:hypothetical protein [Caballeronia sp. LZ035]MDR5757660.1 hypothetical protein [Caballeronia sp. LZ035]
MAIAAVTKHIPTHLFSDETFLRDNIEFVETYAIQRVRGMYGPSAFRRVFGSVNCIDPMDTRTRVDMLESTYVYADAFDRYLAAMSVDKILSDKKALHGYLDIANNPMMKESVRVAALKEACVLAGITVIDDAGRTKRVPTLDDLYTDPKPEAEKPNAGLH